MTDAAGVVIADPFDQLPPFADATASPAECAAAVERRAEQLARIADDRADQRTGDHAQNWRRLAHEASEEAAKARHLANRARLHATATPTPPGETTSAQDHRSEANRGRRRGTDRVGRMGSAAHVVDTCPQHRSPAQAGRQQTAVEITAATMSSPKTSPQRSGVGSRSFGRILAAAC